MSDSVPQPGSGSDIPPGHASGLTSAPELHGARTASAGFPAEGLAPAALWPVVRVAAAHPSIWPVALLQAVRLAEPQWWRRRRAPVPTADLWGLRMETAYGDRRSRPSPSDVLHYLRWCRGMGWWRRQ